MIDFGVAKAVDAAAHRADAVTPSSGTFVGTPEYMSPEQAEMTGLDVDTRTRRVLAGRGALRTAGRDAAVRPRDVAQRRDCDEIRRTIREEEPPRPSTRMSHTRGGVDVRRWPRSGRPCAKLARLLRGDLDWITMKALEKDRTRRYETANALALDVRRHLKHEPVSAGPPTAITARGSLRSGIALASQRPHRWRLCSSRSQW